MKPILFITIVFLMITFGCRKNDEPQIPDGTKSSSVVPLITKDTSGDANISGANPASFTGKFTVDLYFKNGDQPQKFDIVAIKNGDKSIVKTIQADVTTFPTTLTITGEQLLSFFGGSIVAGDNFEIGANITLKDGEFFEAFPAVGEAYGTNVNNELGASVSVNYGVLCGFDADAFAGDFTVVEDVWQDYQPGDVIHITKVDETHLSFNYAAPNAPQIIIAVDPATNIPSVAKQKIGDYGDGGDYQAETVAGDPGNSIAPCDGTLSLTLDFFDGNTELIAGPLKLQKK